jgi:hypothetical protein
VFIVSQRASKECQNITAKSPTEPAKIVSSSSPNKFPMLLPIRDEKSTFTESLCRKAPQLLHQTAVLPHAAYRQQLLNAFIYSYVPVDQIGILEEKPWLMLLPDLPTPTKALETSTLAICIAKLGRLNDDPMLVRESLRLYTQGLSELQSALWDPNLMYKDETLGACMALAMYELIECPAKTRFGYASHQNGCARLVQLRGAEAHKSGLGHQIFLTFRLQEVCIVLSMGLALSQSDFILQSLCSSLFSGSPSFGISPVDLSIRSYLDRIALETFNKGTI